MSFSLTEGAIERIMAGENVEKPILQVLGQKKIPGSQGADRYRLLLSDGKHSYSSSMLATQHNEKITSGELDVYSVFKLDKYLCNTIQPDRRVIIMLDVSVVALAKEVTKKLGNPQTYRPSGQQSVQPDSTSASANNRPAGNVRPQNGASAPGANRPPVSSDTSASKPAGFYGGQQPTKKPYTVQAVSNTTGATPTKVHPIASLTPYQNRWTIRVRVTQKSGIRTWSNSRGEGKLFSVNLLDDSGEIRATLFKSEVDKFYDFIELNKVYYVSKATLKTADKRYSSVNNDYEMTFNSDTTVIPCEEDTNLPTIKFNFVRIGEMEKHAANSNIDVIGVVKSVADVTTVIAKQTQKEIIKREVHLVDDGQVSIRLTLWGTEAENFDGTGNPILAIKGCRLSDWGGRSLSAVSSSQLILNPDIPEAHQMRGWYDDVGHSVDFQEFQGGSGSSAGFATTWKTFAEVKAENLGQEKPDYFTAKATIVFLKKENCMYMACPQEGCNKKVVDQANGQYRCEKCNKEYPNYKWRMILSLNLADYTDNHWVTCFQDTAEAILGKTADEVGHLRENNESQFDQMFQEASFKSFIFKMRAKMETYNDESRLKVVCVQSSPVGHQDYSRKLIEDIEKLLAL